MPVFSLVSVADEFSVVSSLLALVLGLVLGVDSTVSVSETVSFVSAVVSIVLLIAAITFAPPSVKCSAICPMLLSFLYKRLNDFANIVMSCFKERSSILA